jgi:hypothetical protein
MAERTGHESNTGYKLFARAVRRNQATHVCESALYGDVIAAGIHGHVTVRLGRSVPGARDARAPKKLSLDQLIGDAVPHTAMSSALPPSHS